MTASTILVADDQASPRNRVAQVLRERGFRVLLAADGLQALASCRREQPEVVVLDLVMPHMDGVAVCRALRADPVMPYLPILFCSSHDATADRVAALRAGGDDFVSKSIDDEELVARVEVLLRIKRLLDRSGGSTAPAPPEREPGALPPVGDQHELERQLAREFESATRHNQPLSVVVIALEHPDDDEPVSRVLSCVRGKHRVARYRDLGLAVILPNTHFGGAMALAEKAWHALAEAPGFAAHIGAACYPNPAIGNSSQLLDIAGAAVDRARAEGPAHICLYHHQAYLFRPDR